jgi:hypothetical protein
MKRLLPAVVIALLAATSPAPALDLERLPPGPLPGKPVSGKFGGSVRDVRELISVGHRHQRIRLLIARGRTDQLCVAGVAGARRSRFICLASWDHPPLIARVGVGGGSRAKTNWLGVVGLVRADVAAVTLETDRSDNRAVELHGPPGFPWKAFAVAPSSADLRGRDLPHSIRARDAAGAVLQRIDFGWAHRAPCQERKRGCPSRAQRRGRWSEARDPIAEKQAPFIKRGGGTRSKRIAFAHPAVPQIVANQPFSFDGVAIWTKCNGRLIGGVVTIRLSRPITFEGDVPLHGYRNGSAYLEGVWHLRVENAIGFHIYVDLRRKRVVGIAPDDDLLDGREGGRPPPKTDFTIVQPPRPSGGRDSGDCESKPGD